MSTLYEQIGGKAAVESVVEVFYQKILADPRIARFFEGVDMDRQIAKQKMFLAYAFGGAPNYPGKRLGEAHAHLVEEGLDDSHFDAVGENLQSALRDLNTPEHFIGKVMEIVESTRDVVLGRAEDTAV